MLQFPSGRGSLCRAHLSCDTAFLLGLVVPIPNDIFLLRKRADVVAEVVLFIRSFDVKMKCNVVDMK